MKRILIVTIAVLLFFVVSQTVKANIYEELPRTCSDPMRMSMVLWMPDELFEEMSEHWPRGTLEEIQEMLKGYSLIAATDGRITPLGRVVYQPDSDVRKDLAVIINERRYHPVSADDTPDAVRHLQDEMQRAWAETMGEMGRNMRLYLFAVELDAASQGEFLVRLGGTESKEELFRYETPLRAVVPDIPCIKCEYSVRASWNYCPRCGHKK